MYIYIYIWNTKTNAYANLSNVKCEQLQIDPRVCAFYVNMKHCRNVYVYMCKHVYMHTCIHTLIFQDILYMLTSMHVQKYICTCKQQIWTYVYVYVYIYTYTYGNMHIRRNLKQHMQHIYI